MGLKLGLAALCVALCVAAAWQHTSHSVSLLNVKTAALEAAQDEKHFKTLFLDAHAESKEAAGHEKLAAKDVRVQRSLMLAADQLNSNRRAEDTKMQLLHRQQAELDAKLERLTTLWASQKTALEYASRQIQGFDYRLKGERSVLTSERSVVQHLRKKVKVLDEETNSARKKYPEALKQVSDAKRVLRKAEDALKDDRARAVAAGDKATYARSEEQLDLAKGRVAAKQSAMLTSEAVAAKGNNAAHAWQLKKRADQDKGDSTGEATVLRAKAAEAQSRAQVEQAKAAEAQSRAQVEQAEVKS
ncbi:hypothetical protein T484DRAFT_1767579 [Baffinella frigidus]|nr:hypothetical protein T484DRAFT_1767579 [Cryptophyta sp. CCMP2293]